MAKKAALQLRLLHDMQRQVIKRSSLLDESLRRGSCLPPTSTRAGSACVIQRTDCTDGERRGCIYN